MPAFTPFTNNYRDISDQHGYQFEFLCDICGTGYKSQYQRSAMGTAGSLLDGASSIIGGIFGRASSVADQARDLTDRGAKDQALQKASNEIMPLFKMCPRDHRWVDETCWNEERGLCVNDAPKLAVEMEAERASVELDQMRQAMTAQTVFKGDLSTRQTVCANCGKPIGSEKFCANCGTPTGMNKCSKCGADLATGARFCGNCGNQVG